MEAGGGWVRPGGRGGGGVAMEGEVKLQLVRDTQSERVRQLSFVFNRVICWSVYLLVSYTIRTVGEERERERKCVCVSE